MEFHPAGTFVKAWQIHGAVSKGVLDVGYVTGQYVYGKHKGFALLSVLPFGPSTRAFARWRVGRGEQILNELFQNVGLNVHGITCGMNGPEGEFWATLPVRSLQSLKIRNVGLFADVFQGAGAKVVQLPGREVIPALERGIIDAFNFNRPYVDIRTGAQDVAKYYYYPSPSHPAEAFDLIINLDKWKEMPITARTLITETCREQMRYTIDDDERRGKDAFATLRTVHSVNVLPVPSSIEQQLRSGWQRVSRVLRNEPDLARILDEMEQIPR
jgi:TRAP-type mannitol/chloroaromatic compound transport system substrate-binding protein